MKIYVYKRISTDIFITALFIGALLEAAKCPSTGEWKDKLCYIPSTKCYSVIKRNEKLICIATLKNFKYIMLSERRLTQINGHWVIPFR